MYKICPLYEFFWSYLLEHMSLSSKLTGFNPNRWKKFLVEFEYLHLNKLLFCTKDIIRNRVYGMLTKKYNFHLRNRVRKKK